MRVCTRGSLSRMWRGSRRRFCGGSIRRCGLTCSSRSMERGRWEPGRPLRFDLLLFGQAVDLQAYVFLAVERMARSGLGSRRARFRLVRVEAAGVGGAKRVLFAAGGPPSASPAPPLVTPETPLPEGPVTLRLETPLRIKLR